MSYSSLLGIDRPTHFGKGAKVDRFFIAPGLDGAVFEYSQTEGHRRGAVSERIEIGVQLTGERVQAGRAAGVRNCLPGNIQVLGHAEPYDITYRADTQPGIVVYFLFDEARFGALDADRELRFDDRCPRFTRVLASVAEHVFVARAAGQAFDAEAVLSTLGAAVAANAAAEPGHPLVCARKEIEKHFNADLYLRHLAENAGMHRTVFLRRFAQRYGITPVQYRIRVRLNEADRLALLDPERSTASIAAECGFESPSYFYRAYAGYFGASASQRRARTLQSASLRSSGL